MVQKEIVCRHCGEEFAPEKGKPGYIDECLQCLRNRPVPMDVAKVGGNMVWDHKTAPRLEVKPMWMARIFNRKAKRPGASVCTGCLTRSTEKMSQWDLADFRGSEE